jgi:sulfite exporter TauE/SafE
MIVIVIVPEKILINYNFSKLVYKIIAKIKTGLGNQFKKRTNKVLFITGVLNGFLPCGLVYAALFGALAMQNVALGSFYMLLYGLGTVPLMSAVVYTADIIKNPLRNTATKLVPYAAVIIGLLFIVRGLGLSIPYISPGTMSLFVQQMPNCK